eukprot:TRINITY_DN58152_c0_g1_i1.p1 TRINITY_DN58152_c0_g1~~TRINITY_DN58152_c0_g1_i1.p1  ORF type:complete len:307 (-),score=96.16 TRINITY_DN58152_c0_g1_i1:140-1060(-)
MGKKGKKVAKRKVGTSGKSKAGTKAKAKKKAEDFVREGELDNDDDAVAEDNLNEEDGDEEQEAGEAEQKRPTKAHRFAEGGQEAKPKEHRGVVYLGHIPNGFFEPQMLKYFSQFGKVSRMRLSRSKKTGGSKGYAFIEFQEESVAKIVAQTMNKYLLFEKTLVCEFMPKEKCHKDLFKGCRQVVQDKRAQRRAKELQRVNDRPSVEVAGKAIPQKTYEQVKRRHQADVRLQALLEQLEVDYDIKSVVSGSAEDDDDDEAAAKPSKKRRKGKASAESASAAAAVPEKNVQAAAVASKKKTIKKKRGR